MKTGAKIVANKRVGLPFMYKVKLLKAGFYNSYQTNKKTEWCLVSFNKIQIILSTNL